MPREALQVRDRAEQVKALRELDDRSVAEAGSEQPWPTVNVGRRASDQAENERRWRGGDPRDLCDPCEGPAAIGHQEELRRNGARPERTGDRLTPRPLRHSMTRMFGCWICQNERRLPGLGNFSGGISGPIRPGGMP